MKKIYSITFYLFIELLLLSAPQAYSVATPDEDKDYARFLVAMQAYEENRSINNPSGAHRYIRNELLLPRTVCQLLVSGYIRKNYATHNKYFSNELTSLVLSFMLRQDSYNENAKKILDWATQDRMGVFFITDYLKEAYTLRRFYDKVFLSNLTFNLRKHQLDIYAHEYNFSDKELLLWLIKKLNWRVPTDAQIQNYQARYNIRMVCRMIRYKLKTIQALSKGDMDLYNMSYCYLLKGPNSVIDPPPFEKIGSAELFKNLSCRDKCLSYFFSCYWLHYYPGPYSAGGNVRKDICIDIGAFVTLHGTFVLLVYSFMLFGGNSEFFAENSL